MEGGSGLMDPVRLLPFLLSPFEGLPGFHIVDYQLPADGQSTARARWIPGQDVDALVWLLKSNVAFQGDVTLSAIPYLANGSRLGNAMGAALFVRTETGAAAAALAKVKNRPTLVLQEGTSVKHVAFWALEEGATAEEIANYNRKLSHVLKTPAWACEPNFRFHPPGAVLRAGRKRPVPVVVAEQNEDAVYSLSAFAHLADRPKPDPSKWNK